MSGEGPPGAIPRLKTPKIIKPRTNHRVYSHIVFLETDTHYCIMEKGALRYVPKHKWIELSDVEIHIMLNSAEW